MQLSVEIIESIERIVPGAYESFFHASGASLFYDPQFLRAAERSPLLPALGTYYVLVLHGRRIVAFMPVYLQRLMVVDPLGVLRQNAGLVDDGCDLALLSHIMHCFTSTIPSIVGSPHVYPLMFDALADLAQCTGARYYGLLNVCDEMLLAAAIDRGMHVNYMVDRFYTDLDRFGDFDDFVEQLPADGRREMNRQLRKFTASGACSQIIAPPFDGRLQQLAALCHATTSRHGTPQYFPTVPLAEFCRLCGSLVRLCTIETGGRVVGGLICFEGPDTFYTWSAGVTYDQTDFSPYTIAFAASYRYAFERNLHRLEGGRLNARIKTRLGMRPGRLYAVTSDDLKPAAARVASLNHMAVSETTDSIDSSLRKE
ncbi:GNAT family N-acetyltransferase (plasmid) [Burkholderia sp. FERM BP-3421]|uniref:GNAT family N-acetyltransferase n=1 Tax=Burkholderia sp. FERM BP-3421 TaxID=1494466 RepID=UPI00235F6A32|nr:GNAT family N-acetyltransferase [Burkholderia sp. FERM BP-3421]WDD90435.1 GNAT family N-acetyltransferase [Burkholderia sp. FERM BP-3421]